MKSIYLSLAFLNKPHESFNLGFKIFEALFERI